MTPSISWAGQNVEWKFQNHSFERTNARSFMLTRQNVYLIFWTLRIKNTKKLRWIPNESDLRTESSTQGTIRLFSTCFIQLCSQFAEWEWSIILGMIKTHRNFRVFQKQAEKFKQISLQGRSLFEIASSLLIAKREHAFRAWRKFVHKKGFPGRRLQKFISLVTLIRFPYDFCY